MKITSDKNIGGSHTKFNQDKFRIGPAGFDFEEIHTN
jgi:hypothetical protein